METRKHLIGVYGDNFIQEGKFKIAFYPVVEHSLDTVSTITQLEPDLLKKKEEMAKFQKEYMDLKRRYEEAKERLKREDTEILEKLKTRDNLYDTLVKESEVAFAPPPSEVATNKSSNFFSKIFG